MLKVHKSLLFLKKVPNGRVVSYGELARKCQSSPRAIGMIMKNNKRPDIYPCYRVVKTGGCVGGYAGCIKGENIKKKIELLERDGIMIKNGKIEKRYFYRFG